jgi:phosphatidylcholine synthase
MGDTGDRFRVGPAQYVAAWSVHLLTASGAVWALLALEAISRSAFRAGLGWMALAVLVDGIDGVLARRVRVDLVLPHIDGSLLDNLVDYCNYVLVPAFLIQRAALLPASLSLAGAAAICLASAFQFVHAEAKADERFRGFPSYWNCVALYLLLLGWDAWVSLAVVAIGCALVLAPVRFIYPTRTRELRRTTLTLTVAWALAVIWIVWRFPDQEPWWVYASLAYPAYLFVASFWLQARAAKA